MICPYCKKQAEWVENKRIYGKNYGKSYMMYYCKSCDAYVGCHNNTCEPLGVMANKELRGWRKKAHNALDPLWKGKRYGMRSAVYNTISFDFVYDVHIGNTDIKQCQEIIAWCENKTHRIKYRGNK